MGVNRLQMNPSLLATRIPHVCGGEPTYEVRPRGKGRIPHVCGGEPRHACRRLLLRRIPHVCGGEPGYAMDMKTYFTYSPRVWG